MKVSNMQKACEDVSIGWGRGETKEVRLLRFHTLHARQPTVPLFLRDRAPGDAEKHPHRVTACTAPVVAGCY